MRRCPTRRTASRSASPAASSPRSRPFFGLHFFSPPSLAWLLRANILAALIGTFAGNPLTFPLIASLSLALGRRILGYGGTGRDFGRIGEAFEAAAARSCGEVARASFGHGAPEWRKLTPFFTDVLWPYLVGGLLPGPRRVRARLLPDPAAGRRLPGGATRATGRAHARAGPRRATAG